MRWAGHIDFLGEEREMDKVLMGRPKGKYNSEDREVHGTMGSEWILRKLPGGWSAFSWLRIGTGDGLL
jgi:hypothetical protein